MKFPGIRLKELTLVKAAVYIFLLALCAKGVALYASQHPSKEELVFIEGFVKKVRLGGDGRATRFQIKSGNVTYKCSSYYGKVWPGMEHIQPGDRVTLLIERNKLDRNELIRGKSYYIWQLIHGNNVVVAYEDIHEMVKDKEEAADRFFNGILAVSSVLVVVAYLRKKYLEYKK
jgi:hypothetical protein